MPDAYLQLGDFEFQGLELPEVIKRGGKQAVIVQKLVGGARTIDAMGRDDDPLSWEGIFMGAAAYDRASYLDSLRIAGQQLVLAWNNNNYTVLISEYVYESRLDDLYIPYRITCEVVSDNVTPSIPGVAPSVDDQMAADSATASNLATGIGDSALSSLTSALNSAVGAVGTFANATQATIQSVMQPLAAVSNQVGVLMNAAQSLTGGVTSLGGVVPGTPIAANVAALTGQIGAFQQVGMLSQMAGVIGRMAQNVTGSGTNTTTMTVGGGSLMSIASTQYGDATGWTAIAAANGMTDPQIQGIRQIVVPIRSGTSGGLLGGT